MLRASLIVSLLAAVAHSYTPSPLSMRAQSTRSHPVHVVMKGKGSRMPGKATSGRTAFGGITDKAKKKFTKMQCMQNRNKIRLPEKWHVTASWTIEMPMNMKKARLVNPDPDMGQSFQIIDWFEAQKITYQLPEFIDRISKGGRPVPKASAKGSKSSGSASAAPLAEPESDDDVAPEGWGGRAGAIGRPF